MPLSPITNIMWITDFCHCQPSTSLPPPRHCERQRSNPFPPRHCERQRSNPFPPRHCEWNEAIPSLLVIASASEAIPRSPRRFTPRDDVETSRHCERSEAIFCVYPPNLVTYSAKVILSPDTIGTKDLFCLSSQPCYLFNQSHPESRYNRDEGPPLFILQCI